jgi:hypothetical protein
VAASASGFVCSTGSRDLTPRVNAPFCSKNASGVPRRRSASPPRRITSQVPDFLFHHGLHQREPCFSQQVTHALLQQIDDVGQRKDHLDVWILLRGDPAELLHGSLLFDLVLSLHSDSLLFLGRKTNRRPIMAASLRVATFFDLPGIVPPLATVRHGGRASIWIGKGCDGSASV